MSKTGAIAVPAELSESRRTALLTLLADEDPAIYRDIRQRILSLGPVVADWLKPYTLSEDPALRRRAQEIVRVVRAQAADNRFLGFCLKHGEAFDLEQGAWLLAQTQYPDINVEGYQALLDGFACDLAERLVRRTEPEAILSTVNRYLFGKLGFSGNDSDYYDAENSYLNRVLDRRTGNANTLCQVYLLIARRLRLPVVGIGLPGHFVCRYQSTAGEIYIDAFHQGKLLTKADCIQYLLQGNYHVGEEHLGPVSPRRMLLRICGNLHRIYLHQENSEAAVRVQRYLVALAR